MSFAFARSYRGPVRAVILDWAGTTADYGCCAPAVVFVDLFRKHGVTISMEQARGPMGTAKREHIRQLTTLPEVQAQWIAAKSAPVTDADVDAMYAEFIPMQLACLAQYADLIPGTLEAVAAFRARGIKIGTTTGYNREMLEICKAEGAKRGFVPDNAFSASDVPAGRPAPWMALASAMDLGVYPLEAIVKIGDTAPDIDEGLNAGMWTIGLAVTGNEVGLTEAEVRALPPAEFEVRRAAACRRLAQAGAHYVVDGIADCPPIIDRINERLARGERP